MKFDLVNHKLHFNKLTHIRLLRNTAVPSELCASKLVSNGGPKNALVFSLFMRLKENTRSKHSKGIQAMKFSNVIQFKMNNSIVSRSTNSSIRVCDGVLTWEGQNQDLGLSWVLE